MPILVGSHSLIFLKFEIEKTNINSCKQKLVNIIMKKITYYFMKKKLVDIVTKVHEKSRGFFTYACWCYTSVLSDPKDQ